jgi:hypothetical protein
MNTPVIREEVQAYVRACGAVAEFCRDHDLTMAELKAIENVPRILLYGTPSPDVPLLASTLSLID